MEKQLVKINRKVLSKEKEISLSLDFIVPDIKPDIVAVIDTNANTYIYKEELSSARIRFDGNIDAKVLYLSDAGETKSLSVMLDFSEIIDDELINSGLRYNLFVELTSIDTKIMNERKILVSASAKIHVEFFEAKEIELIASLNDFENLQKKEENIKIKNFIGSNKAKGSIKETLECDTMDSVLDILKTDIKIGKTENKVSYNKVLSKTDCELSVIYQTENMEIKSVKNSYPIMTFLDIENVKEENFLETNVSLKNMQVFLSQNDSNKINLNLEFETSLEVYEIKEISLISDIYSLNTAIEFTKKDFMAELASENIESKVSISESFSAEDISRIVDSRSNIRIINKERTNGVSNYNLEVNVKTMYELDSRSGIAVKNASFNTWVKVEEDTEDCSEFCISKEDYNINGDKVFCDIEISNTLKKNKFKSISVLDNIVEKEDETKNEYSLIVYFVKPKDTIWEIAKNFRVSMQSIIDTNNLENPDKINIGDRLYIVR